MPKENRIIIVMGVSGCGKSTVGLALSEAFHLPFYDADDFHPKANIDKMSQGLSLTDDDRHGWLTLLGTKIMEWQEESGAVLACSALKEKYRQLLSTVENIEWVILEVDEQLIRARFADRNDHFMPSALIESQFNTLEMPEYGLKVKADLPITAIVEYVTGYLKSTN